jgi:hypothetical protein
LAAGLGWLVLALLTIWAVAALYFDVRMAWLRTPLAVAYGVAAIAVVLLVKRRLVAMGVCAGGFLLVLVWWLRLQPSNVRDWQPDVAVLAHADIAGDQVTIHNIRNCDYRTTTDYDVRHYDKTFDLGKLRSTDLFLVYWGSPHIAHTMVSFGFEGGYYVCMSIETRKEKGEHYSAIKGLYRQFELSYIIADESDLVRLRTNYRPGEAGQGEEVYLYRARMSPEQSRRLFLDYLRRANQLRDRPEWYNALTDNCTTAIRTQRATIDRAPWDWRMLVNGHLDELLYEQAMIVTNLPFAELRKESQINARARAAGPSADFSQLIRQGLPDPNL